MKNFSILSFSIMLTGISICVSFGYLISTIIVSLNIYQASSTINDDKQIVYAISIQSAQKSTQLQTLKSELQSQNGAGFIYNADDNYYLLSSIYENFNDAELVKNNLKNNSVDSEILTIQLSSTNIEGNFSSEERAILLNCLKIKINTFKKLYDTAISLDTSLINETKAKLECNQVFSDLVSTKSNFETVFKSQKTNNDLKKIKDLLNNIYSHLTNLINENYESNGQTFSSLIKLTYCQILFSNK